MRRFLSKIEWSFLFLCLLLGFVVYSNFPTTSYLSGWDNLHPEFDFWLNVRRAWSGVWVANEGVGAALGHGFSATLPHTLFLWALSFFAPVIYLRSIFTFLMYGAGSIGIYVLSRKMLGKHAFASWGALLAALFYALNLGTVQTFYTQLEAFIAFYGLLPWVILTIGNYLEQPSRKRLLVLLGLQMAFSVVGFIPPLFVSFGLVLAGMIIGHLWHTRGEWRRAFTNSLVVIVTILATHAYWLVPVVHYAISGSTVYVEAKNNRLSTPDFQYMSEARGTFADTMLLRGFFIDSSDSVISGEGKFFHIFEAWLTYIPNVAWIGYVVFGFVILGVVELLRRSKSGYVIGATLTSLLVGFVVLTQGEKVFADIVALSRDLPILGQAFRAAWTKFSGILMLAYALLLPFGVWSLGRVWKQLQYISLFALIALIGLFGKPIFQGNLIYERLKVSIPSEYFSLFNFMRSQDSSGRIANLPLPWMWGWTVTRWGYSGSGFLWYGIPQPVLDRAFDVWSPSNETFYNQLSTALYGGSKDAVKQVLDTYDVRYVLLDESLIAPGQDQHILRVSEIKNLMLELESTQVFQQGSLTVWDRGVRTEQSVSAPAQFTWVDGETLYSRVDLLQQEHGTYVSGRSTSEEAVYYPFSNLLKEEVRAATYSHEGVELTQELPTTYSGVEHHLVFPGFTVGEIVRINYRNGVALPAYTVNGFEGPRFRGKEKPELGKSYLVARVSEGSEWREYLQDTSFDIQASAVTIQVGGESFVYDFSKEGQQTVGNCDLLKRGIGEKVIRFPSEKSTQYIADGQGSICDYIVMQDLDTRLAYLMRIQGENVRGRSAKFFLYNLGSKRNDIEYLLNKTAFDQTFTLLPWRWDAFYSLNIDVRSFGERSENILKPVEVYYFPLKQLSAARFVGDPSLKHKNDLKIVEVKKWGTWLYSVTVEGSGLLKLSQGYDKGWISFGLPHVKVDGWANGWMIPQSGVATIFYWPQLLGYLGFGLFGLTFILILRRRS